MSTREAVKVVVRCRPLNKREKKLKCAKAVVIRGDIGQIQLMKPSDRDLQILGEDPPKSFTFDAVYGGDSEQRSVFNDTGFPLVQSVLEGYNGTVFAYGQTGCGKTFSMMGEEEPPEMRGVIPSSFEQIFNTIEQDQSRRFLVTVAFIELYNEEVRDLLGDNPKQKLDLKESKDQGVFVAGLTHNIVRNVSEMKTLQKRGNTNRTVGRTNMNAESSRSHSIFTIKIETSEAGDTPDSSGHIRAGKLNLVDLAGSERQSKTGAEGKRLKEATKINMSLSALGNVISALVAGKGKHIPYRDSKLTRLLQDSLGGNTKTVMIACISPSTDSYDETLSTLRYANRAKNIKNKPTINEDPKDALLREYQSEIDRLKKMLQTQSEQIPSSEAVPAQQGKVELSMDSKQVRVVEGASTGLSQADMDSLRDRLQAQHEEKARALEKEREEARKLQMRLHEEWKKIKEIQTEQEKEKQEREEKQDTDIIEHLKTGGDTQDDRDHVSAEDFGDDRDEETLNEQQKQLEMAMDVNAERGMDLDNQINGVIREMEENESMTTDEFEDLLVKKEAELEVSRQQLQKERDASNKRLAEREAQTSEESDRLKEALRILESQLLEGDRTVEQEKRRHEMEMQQAEADILEQKRKERELNLEKKKAEEKKLLLEEHYETMQEEVEASRLKMKKLQKRLAVAQNDASDLQEEFEREREGMLEQIRELARDSELYQQISQLLVSPRQLERIVKHSKWNPTRERWDIPRFSRLKKFPKIIIHDRGTQPSDGEKTPQKGARKQFGNMEMEDEPMPELSQRRRYSSSNSSEMSRPVTSRPKTTSRLHKMDMDQAKESLQDELYQARLHKMQEEVRAEKMKQAQTARQLLQQQPIQATKQSARSKNEKDILQETIQKVPLADRARWNSELCIASETVSDKNAESNSKQRDIEQLLGELPSASNFQPALKFVGATSVKDELSPKQRALEALLSTVPLDLPKFQPTKLGYSEKNESSWLSPDLAMDLSRRSFSPSKGIVEDSSEDSNFSWMQEKIANLPQSRPQFVPADISYEEAASSHLDYSSRDMLSSATSSTSVQQTKQRGAVSRKDDVDALIQCVLGANKMPFKPTFSPNKNLIETEASNHTKIQNTLHNAPAVPLRFEPARPSTAFSEDVGGSASTGDQPSTWEPQPPLVHHKPATRSMPPSREYFAPDRSLISSNNIPREDTMLSETPNRRPAFDPSLASIGNFPKPKEPDFLRDDSILKKMPFAPTGKPLITLDATFDPSIIADLPDVQKANFEPGPKPLIPDTTSALPNDFNKASTQRKFDITRMRRVP